MKLDSTFSSVVLPAPVPPETMMFSRHATTASQEIEHRLRERLAVDQILRAERSVRKRRIDSTGPSSASGGMIALTREPSGRRASTIGLDSSMRRPTDADDALDDAQQVRVVLEDDVGLFEHAVPLDVDLIVAVDQDVGDVRVLQQRLERAEPEELVQDVGDQRSRARTG